MFTLDKEYCCGCTACMSICPVAALEMREDECGFEYPIVNDSLCINCGKCSEVCEFKTENTFSRFQNVYVVKHQNADVVMESRSGGVFTALSDFVLLNGGAVYGAVLDSDLVVRHHRAINEKERNAMRKSKYVQTNLADIFGQVKKDLQSGLLVLFSGTGCQCDGLHSYLRLSHVEVDKLILLDLICHSSASPGIYRDYLNYYSRKIGSRVTDFYFRDKEKFDWREHVEKIIFENGKVVFSDEYTNLFYGDNIRSSCFSCKYTSLKRGSDITIADCWYGDKKYPEIVNETGASLVLVNSDKGRIFFDKVKDDLLIRDIDIDTVFQPRMAAPEKKSKQYEQFWNDYKAMEFGRFLKKYTKNTYSSSRMALRYLKIISLYPVRVLKRVIRMIIYERK